MRDLILNFPQQLKTGAELGKTAIVNPADFEKIIICGMGGSMIPGEILLTAKSDFNLPQIFINRDYDLPDFAGNKDLVICVSDSGNTEETISSLETAAKKGLTAVVIAPDGSKMAELAKTNGFKLASLPKDETPARFGVGYMLGALLAALGLENELDFELKTDEFENEGKALAEKIATRIPVVYASFKWRKLASFWKILFNENAKIPAFWNSFPALAHNEIESFKKDVNLFPVIIKDIADDSRQNRNIDTAIALFDKLGYNYNIVKVSPEGKILEKTLKNYLLGLWTSLYLAEKLNVDPLKTGTIEEFKRLKTE